MLVFEEPTLEPFNGCTKVSSVIKMPNQEKNSLWFVINSPFKLDLDLSAFIIPSVALGMSTANDVYFDYPVDRTHLANLEEVIEIFCQVFPNLFTPIRVTCKEEVNAEKTRSDLQSVMCFSGGVDACSTFYLHKKQLRGRRSRNISHGILVHGFDIPLHAEDRFQQAISDCEKMLNSLDSQIITIKTNWRQIIPNWPYLYIAGITSCMTLFSKHFSNGVIASGDFSIDIPMVDGSHAGIDSFWGSAQLPFYLDCVSKNRLEKIESISSWPEAMKYLRVCYESADITANCCRCEKCIRTILSFRAATKSLPACFPEDVSDIQIERLYIPDQTRLQVFRTLLDGTSKYTKKEEAWIKTLRRRVNLGITKPWHRFRPKRVVFGIVDRLNFK